MIGIALKINDDIIITEFFELFKTPWEFFRSNQPYEVIITDELYFDKLENKLVVVIHRGENFVFENNQTEIRQPVIACCGDDIFPIYVGYKQIKGGSPLITLEKTGECIGNCYYDGNTTILHLGYDFFEEVRYLLSNGQPSEFANFPTLEIHIANLRRWILEAGAALIEIPPIAKNSKFFACLTHDVDFAGIRNYKFDRTLAGFVYRALVKSIIQYLKGECSLKILAKNWVAIAELPFIYLGLYPDFWATFKQYREIEREAPSTFFFVPFKDRPGKLENNNNAPSIRAVKYDIFDLKKDILYLIAEGCEIGVHGIDSWLKVEDAEEEIIKVRNLTGQFELGVRMHWLYLRSESAATLEKAGYIYDSTCGYNEKIGYQAGTVQVYRLLGAKQLLELPMHIMDTSLFYPDHMNLTQSEGITAIQSLIEKAIRFGGVLTFNWHDRSIAAERHWDGVYHWILNELRFQGARFLTAGTMVDWFRKRRAVIFNRAYNNSFFTSNLKLTGLNMSPADGMVLRVYSPTKRLHQQQIDKPISMVYQDILLGEQKEIEIVL